LCTKIVSAHTVSRSGVLRRILDNKNRVRTFYRAAFDSTTEPEVRSIGWRTASTFSGFCGLHDSKTFESLEMRPFAATPEQCFLIGYRAICHEAYQKRAALRAVPKMRELADRGLPEEFQRDIQHRYSAMASGYQKGLRVVELLKTRMD